MRLRIPAAVWFAVSGVALLAAQAAPPSLNPASAAVPQPRSHAKPSRPSAPSAPQVIFDATSLGSPLILDKGWRVGITSDPAAATPGFNDSAWAIRNAQAAMDEVPDEDETQPATGAKQTSGSPAQQPQNARSQRYAWFRIHIKLAPNHGPVALLIELPVSRSASFGLDALESSPDVFANGRRIQPEGPHGNAPGDYQPISRIYDLNLDPSETSLTLAVRTMYIPFGYGAYTSFFSNRTLRLGNHDDLQSELNLWSDHSLFQRLPRLIYSVLLAVVGVFLFALYFAQKGHTLSTCGWLCTSWCRPPSALSNWPAAPPASTASGTWRWHCSSFSSLPTSSSSFSSPSSRCRGDGTSGGSATPRPFWLAWDLHSSSCFTAELFFSWQASSCPPCCG